MFFLLFVGGFCFKTSLVPSTYTRLRKSDSQVRFITQSHNYFKSLSDAPVVSHNAREVEKVYYNPESLPWLQNEISTP